MVPNEREREQAEKVNRKQKRFVTKIANLLSAAPSAEAHELGVIGASSKSVSQTADEVVFLSSAM